jgi:predicted ATPase
LVWGSGRYHAFGLCAKGCLTASRDDLAAAEEILRAGLKRTREVNYYLVYPFFRSELAALLGAAGDKHAGLAEVNAALRYAESCESLWCLPEVLRAKGEILLLPNEADRTAAEDHFRRSLDLARRQGALSWELRTAISIARLQRDQSSVEEARDLLASVYCRFTEGFDTKRLLNELT